jgi:hypothetical protein
MPKREPRWFEDLARGRKLVAVGACCPQEPVYGGLTGANQWGDEENCLVYPNVADEIVNRLQYSRVPTVAVYLRDNLYARPNRLWQAIEGGAVTWVVYEPTDTDFKPIAAFVDEEPVGEELFHTIHDAVTRLDTQEEA